MIYSDDQERGKDYMVTFSIANKPIYFLTGCYAKYRSDSSFKGRAVVEVIQARNEEECARYTVKK